MLSIDFILILLAAIFSALAAAGVPLGRLNLIGAALFSYFLTMLV